MRIFETLDKMNKYLKNLVLLASFLLIVGSANAADIISPVQSIDVYTGDNIIGAADGSRIDGAVEIAVNGKIAKI